MVRACISSAARWTVATRSHAQPTDNEMGYDVRNAMRSGRSSANTPPSSHNRPQVNLNDATTTVRSGRNPARPSGRSQLNRMIHGATGSVGGRSETNSRYNFHLPSCYRNYDFTKLLFSTCLESTFWNFLIHSSLFKRNQPLLQ